MKTDELITALAADAQTPRAPIDRVLWLGAGAAVLLAGALFLVMLPMRPDLMDALDDWHFLLKWVFSLTLLATAMALILRLARPQGASPTQLLILLGAPLALAVGVVTELIVLPSSFWMPTMIGTNAMGCIVFVPILSALPLIAMIVALRQGAPAQPVLAGGVAGLVAAGIAATFYATHCQNDSPLFLAAWYVLATAIVVLVGAFLGGRLLRW